MTLEPEFCRLALTTLGPPAAIERINGLYGEQGVVMPPKAGLIALALDQEELLEAAPRQMRQVPTIRLVVSAGSSSVGASSRLASALTCGAPMVAGGRKSGAAQLLPSGQAMRLTPAPIVANQLVGELGSMDG